MIFFPHAKINIGLNIVEKRSDGYHELETVMLPIGIYDILEVTPSTEMVFKSSGLAIDVKAESNLCIKAYNAIRDKYDIPNVRIHLRKQIPMGGGLGGGSSDATFVIRALNQLFNLEMSILEMQKIAATIGSDCAFFVEDMPQLATGRGEILEQVNVNFWTYYLKVINPGIHISTKEAFTGVHKSGDKGKLIQSIQLPVEEWRDRIKNDFEVHIFDLYPELEEIKQQLYKEGAVYASMSGSGSTMYAVFKNKPQLTSSGMYFERILPITLNLS